MYPMLGVGAFFAMFWVGFVLGYEMGFTCAALLFNAFCFATPRDLFRGQARELGAR